MHVLRTHGGSSPSSSLTPYKSLLSSGLLLQDVDQGRGQGQEQGMSRRSKDKVQEKEQNQEQQEQAEEQEQGVYILYGILYNNGSDPTIASNITDQKVKTTV